MHNEFQLIFEGPADTSTDTLRKLKGILIGDLEMSVDKVKEVLESAPIAIKKSNKKEDLKKELHLLRKAGAKVLIVQPSQDLTISSEESDEDLQDFEMEFSLDEITAPELTESIDSETKNEIDELLGELHQKSELVARTSEPKPVPLDGSSKTNLESVASEILELEPVSSQASESQSMGTLAPIEPSPELTSPIITPPVELDLRNSIPNASPKIPLTNRPLKESFNSISSPKLEEIEDAEAFQDRVISLEVLFPKQKKKRLLFSIETLLSVFFSLLVLMVGNIAFLSQTKKNATQQLLEDYLAQLTVRQNANSDLAIFQDLPEVVSIIGKTGVEGFSITSRFKLFKNDVSELSIAVTNSNPQPELEPEQIVHQVQPESWLKRIEVDEMSIAQLAGGKFIARGYAKVFVNQGEQRRRLSADAVLTGRIDASSHKITGTLKLERGKLAAAPNKTVNFERLADGSHRLFATMPVLADSIETE